MWFYVLIACAFALACGVNDGGALVALSLRMPGFRPLVAVVLLAGLVAVGPVVIGTRVASTLAHKLVPFHGSDARVAAAIAVIVALVVVTVLARLRLPTSLTLATIGALVGSGLGYGFAVSWTTTGLVLLAGIAGPLVGAFIAIAARDTLAAVSSRVRGGRVVRHVHFGSYSAECIAYGANDGQRMLAIFALTVTASTRVDIVPWQLVTIAFGFALGAIVGMYRYAGTLGADLAPTRPHDSAAAEVGGAGASLAGALVGAPLSLTQAITGGLVGSASRRGWKRVRWTRTGQVAMAWMLTLPSGLALGVVLAAGVRALR